MRKFGLLTLALTLAMVGCGEQNARLTPTGAPSLIGEWNCKPSFNPRNNINVTYKADGTSSSDWEIYEGGDLGDLFIFKFHMINEYQLVGKTLKENTIKITQKEILLNGEPMDMDLTKDLESDFGGYDEAHVMSMSDNEIVFGNVAENATCIRVVD